MKRLFQRFVQIMFLVLFITLVIKGRVQIWMGLFFLGVLLSLLFGRIYCGWICFMNTAFKGVIWIKKKLHIKSFKAPKFLSSPSTRYFALGLFIAVFVFTIVTGKKLPVLPILFAISIILTLLYPESLWHCYLCPYGTILRIPALKSIHYMKIDKDKCNNCGACKRVCPAEAITKKEKHHEIIKEDCLICMECTFVCKKDAITYK